MSLIQEALRRQKEEAEGRAVTEPSAESNDNAPNGAQMPSPPPPPPLAPASSAPTEATPPVSEAEATPPVSEAEAAPAVAADEPPQPARRDRAWPTLILILLIVLLLAGAGIWMILFAFRQLGESDDASGDAAVDVQATSPEPSQVDPPVAQPPVVPTPSEPAVADTAKDTPAATPGRTQARPVAPPARPAATPAKQVSVRRASWPPLSLTGVIGSGSSGSAIINNEVVGVGESVDGVKIVGIRSQGVELQLEGETQFLKVGGVLK